MNDKTILRIKVPAHLYESVKSQLTLDEAKQNFGMPGAKTVKVKDSSSGDKPKKASAPKKAASPKAKKDGAPEKENEIPKDGHKKVEKKAHSLEELMKIHEMLGKRIEEMQKHEEEKGENINEDFGLGSAALGTGGVVAGATLIGLIQNYYKKNPNATIPGLLKFLQNMGASGASGVRNAPRTVEEKKHEEGKIEEKKGSEEEEKKEGEE